MTLTTVIDIGNFSTKYAYKDKKQIKVGSFPSILHDYKDLEDHEGMERVQYNELDYYVGEAVKNFYFGREKQMYFGNTRKGHMEGQIRLVYALYTIFKETGKNEFNLILTCPYESMISDKEYFIKNFKGEREVIVEGQPFKFIVHNIVMAAEGLGALYFSDSLNCVIVDAGSKTLNVLYLVNGSISKTDSHTINGGTIDNSILDLAKTFAKVCSNINYDYPIVCTGGKAKEMKEHLEDLGYSEVSSAELGKESSAELIKEDMPSYYVNSVGLLLKYGNKFEEMFA
ncbi:hypothetical protein [Bacillus sp. Bos-x628]|uniref:ParM/StbA family protein n=1 Tax=Bacillus maqinnsis TaxID=3229854 RepID=UPI00338EEF0A